MSGANASQSNTYLSQTASKAVDGDLSTYSAATNSYYVGDYWWKVDIGERIIFTNASIYVRDGTCSTNGVSFDCCKYLFVFSSPYLKYSCLSSHYIFRWIEYVSFIKLTGNSTACQQLLQESI